jgi:hypothetical protein
VDSGVWCSYSGCWLEFSDRQAGESPERRPVENFEGATGGNPFLGLSDTRSHFCGAIYLLPLPEGFGTLTGGIFVVVEGVGNALPGTWISLPGLLSLLLGLIFIF